MQTIYTFGYTGSSPKDLNSFIESLDAWLIDIRYSPTSRVPHWNQGPLQKVATHGYSWAKALGNVNYKNGGPIKLANPKAALHFVRSTLGRQPVILLCACKDVETCHRKVAAEYLAEILGAPVEHLPGSYMKWVGMPDHSHFTVISPNGVPMSVHGDPDMSEEARAALGRMADLAVEQYGKEEDDHGR